MPLDPLLAGSAARMANLGGPWISGPATEAFNAIAPVAARGALAEGGSLAAKVLPWLSKLAGVSIGPVGIMGLTAMALLLGSMAGKKDSEDENNGLPPDILQAIADGKTVGGRNLPTAEDEQGQQLRNAMLMLKIQQMMKAREAESSGVQGSMFPVTS